jgi:putative peptidoglycan lipid II flippase
MSSLKKAALWTTGLALLLKLSGFIREAIVAREFGVSAETDGYFSFWIYYLSGCDDLNWI